MLGTPAMTMERANGRSTRSVERTPARQHPPRLSPVCEGTWPPRRCRRSRRRSRTWRSSPPPPGACRPRRAAGHQLHQLGDARGADGMAPALQAAAGVHRAACRRAWWLPTPRRGPLALAAEAQFLALQQLAEGGGVVHLGHVDVLRAQPGHLVGLARSRSPMRSSRPRGEAPPVSTEARIFTGRAPGNASGLLRAEHGRRGPVAHGGAHGPGEGIGHRPVVQDLLDASCPSGTGPGG